VSTLYYQDALVTLYLGDCREVTEWLAADVLVTDPPYGIAWSSQSMSDAARIPECVIGDADTVVRDVALRMWGARPAVVFGSWRQPRPPRTLHRLIWHKLRANPGYRTAAFYPAEEEIYLLGDGFTGKPEQNVIRTDEERGGAHGLSTRIGHPTPKPVGLMERLLIKAPPGTVADPFAGSGSTLVAARNLGRHSIGVEVHEPYCELLARRLDQRTLFGDAS
jgi:hypothetical protein